ncbi:hypothetical protein F5B22DRAFT_592913 [Xylaria bambusicola]|uniref:uncharacterized protein n=1 Tax=Xylaria bambusicola TaxID=326684 RepID=UPI0020084B2B|nr:uncharacterized protein F5B22DRAFT_592913 [Xylaria bambusicola]KAI0522127.1 hypothetical protein F5B22DRAFT_592913 [Xylaria bambusicola]
MATQVSQGPLAMMAIATNEPVVCHTSPMPKGYSFVRKGNTYVTRNCRRQTQESDQIVYAVVNPKKQKVGIRVPTPIYEAVLESEHATRLDREAKVKKRDESIEEHFRETILKNFPHIPHEALCAILRHATAKGSGRVGRAGKLEDAVKAILAVQAHIRHNKTDYEALLKSGTSRESARAKTSQKISEVAKTWGLVRPKRQSPKKSSSKPRTRATATAGRVQKRRQKIQRRVRRS